MEHKNRWLAHLYLMLLEDRSQPGTLLTTGLDAAAVADVIEQPQTSDRVIKRLKASEDIQIVSPLLAQTEKLLSAPTAMTGTTSEATQVQQVTPNAVNPAISMPETSATTTAEKFSVGGRNMVRAKPTQQVAPTPTITRADLGSYFVKGENSGATITETVGAASNTGGGTRSTVWAHYDTTKPPTIFVPYGATDHEDRVNDVAVGAAPGPCLDHTITAGKIGKTGTIRYYAPDAVGSVARQLIHVPTFGNRSELNAVAEHPMTGEVFAVGTTRSGVFPFPVIDNFVAKWAAPPVGGCTNNPFGPTNQLQTAQIVYPTPGGLNPGVLRLNDIQIELGVASGLEVSYVGTTNGPWEKVLVGHTDVALATTIPVEFDFGVSARGLSLAVDDGSTGGTIACGAVGVLGTRYIGAVIDTHTLVSNGGAAPLIFTLYDHDVADSCDYYQTWGGGPPDILSAYPDPESGFFGVTHDGDELFLSGGMEFTGLGSFNTDFDNSLVVNTDTATGANPATSWSFIYGVPGGNYYSKGNAAVPGFGGGTSPLDDSYTAGSIDEFGLGVASTITEGDLAQYDFTGAIIEFRDSACGAFADKDTDGKAVALHAGGDVSVGGSTTAYNNVWEQTGTVGACITGSPPQILSSVDPVYGGTGFQEPDINGAANGGGPSDGYVFRDNSPVGQP